MPVTRSVTHFVALVSLAAGLAGCGEVVGEPAGLGPPAHTQSFPTEPAPPLPAGVDAMTGLQQSVGFEKSIGSTPTSSCL
jgi:hypothetical protein